MQHSNFTHLTPSNRKSFLTREEIKTGTGPKRNRPCYCQSNLKYKNCHLFKEQGYRKVIEPDGRRSWEKGMRLNPVKGFNLGSVIGGK